jgi:hypothetical protein
MRDELRACWLNCYGPDNKTFLDDKELQQIDAMQDAIAPLDDQPKALRQLITRFEACYHEADKEAEYIIKSIAAGHCLEQSQERPPERKKELENARSILSMWCENPVIKGIGLDVGGVPADELFSFIGKLSPLCDRLRAISNTLKVFWKGKRTTKNIDHDILLTLGEPTPVKRWLAASLDKTIKLHLSLPFEIDLF